MAWIIFNMFNTKTKTNHAHHISPCLVYPPCKYVYSANQRCSGFKVPWFSSSAYVLKAHFETWIVCRCAYYQVSTLTVLQWSLHFSALLIITVKSLFYRWTGTICRFVLHRQYSHCRVWWRPAHWWNLVQPRSVTAQRVPVKLLQVAWQVVTTKKWLKAW